MAEDRELDRMILGGQMKSWRCSRGHRWDSSDMNSGISFNIPDVTDGLEAFCGRCMLERAREFLGRVREDDRP